VKRNFALILLLVLGVGLTAAAQTEIALAPGFGDGMVLQRSSNTLLRGQGPPGKTLLIRFKAGNRVIGSPLKSMVDSAGKWRLEVNLETADFLRAKGCWTLSICEEKNKKHQQEYTNILPGDVILLAGWEGQGVSADAKEFESGVQFAYDKAAIRFLDLTGTTSLEHGSAAAQVEWQPWPQSRADVGRYSSLSLRLAHLLALKKYPGITESEYLGIVLVPLRLVESGLDLRRLTTVKKLATDDNLWAWVAESAKNAQTARSKALISNKRHGIVANVPLIHDYDPAVTCLRDAFDPNKPPREWFTFAGAIWSFAPGATADSVH
jgi:hypothetical protein